MSTRLPVTGNTDKTQPENRAFYPALDGLRTVAFFMVFLHHYVALPWGWAGVDLFFVLSGFLITGILYDTRDDRHRVQNFYVRRTLRIFPLYYGIMLLLALLWPLVHWEHGWAWLLWPTYLGNFLELFPMPLGSLAQRQADFQLLGTLHGHPIVLYLGHFWSLCVEEQFYLLWPWMVFWIRDRRKLLWFCLSSIPVGLAIRIAASHLLPLWMLSQGVLAHLTPFRLDDLLIGGLVALLLRGPAREMTLRVARWILPFVLVLALVWEVHSPARRVWSAYAYPHWVITWGLSGLALLSSLILLNALQTGTWVYRVLSLSPLRWAGRLSYGAYVFHDLLHVFYFWVARALTPRHPKPLAVLLGLSTTYLLAWLSFRYFETPFLNRKERWTIRS